MSGTFDFGGQIVWRPSPEYIERAHLTCFMRQHNIKDFDELMRRSTQDVTWFTGALLDYLDIRFYYPYTSVMDLSQGRPRSRQKRAVTVPNLRRNSTILCFMSSLHRVFWSGFGW